MSNIKQLMDLMKEITGNISNVGQYPCHKQNNMGYRNAIYHI